MVTIKVKDFGTMKFNLDWKEASNTCANFVSLARKGFYNGLIFHRIIRHFMIQGGDPTGTGMGGCGYSIKGEFKANGVNNNLSHKRGVLSMARAMDPDSAGSQFFICDANDEFLDGQYAAFGHIDPNDSESLKTLDKIAKVPTDKSNDRPLNNVTIESVTVSDDEPKPEVKRI